MNKIFSHISFLSRKYRRKLKAEITLFKNSSSLRSYIDTFSDINFRKVSPAEKLTIVESTIQTLCRLTGKFNKSYLKIVDFDAIKVKLEEHSNEQADFANALTKYGSDKALTHQYYLVYYHLLKDIKYNSLNILEVGLGTNDISIKANMGRLGKPGASLFAFREFLPNSFIYGADIDKTILFEADRIKTFFIDQTDHAILQKAKEDLGDTKFDLIIDDGLHNSQANFNTIEFALNLLAEDGYLVVEDISFEDLQYYELLAVLLKEKFVIQFINAKPSCLCLIQHASSSKLVSL